MKITYIEDDITTMEYMIKILNKYDIEVIPFNTFEKFNLERPDGLDLILTDGDLESGKNCYNVLQLRERIYKNIPLILYSGNDEYIYDFKRNGFEVFEKGRELNSLLHRLKVYNNKE